MKRYISLAFLLIAFANSASGQGGRMVSDLELLNSNGKVTTIPYFGARNLIVFYVDPDRIGQNDIFVNELRSSNILRKAELSGVTILSAEDAPDVPERLLYKIAHKRAETSSAPILIDPDKRLSTAWRLGSCNDYSTVMILSKSCELLFLSKGKITDEEKSRFYRVIESL